LRGFTKWENTTWNTAKGADGPVWRGHYSLFENHFDQQPVGFTPLDGAGKANDFMANDSGSATVSVLAPQAPTHANAVLLVYHSDKTSHGDQRGDTGVNAHHQLIARIPQ
jgi:hypothetical protein